jgi:hypothetical protein
MGLLTYEERRCMVTSTTLNIDLRRLMFGMDQSYKAHKYVSDFIKDNGGRYQVILLMNTPLFKLIYGEL